MTELDMYLFVRVLFLKVGVWSKGCFADCKCYNNAVVHSKIVSFFIFQDLIENSLAFQAPIIRIGFLTKQWFFLQKQLVSSR